MNWVNNSKPMHRARDIHSKSNEATVLISLPQCTCIIEHAFDTPYLNFFLRSYLTFNFFSFIIAELHRRHIARLALSFSLPLHLPFCLLTFIMSTRTRGCKWKKRKEEKWKRDEALNPFIIRIHFSHSLCFLILEFLNIDKCVLYVSKTHMLNTMNRYLSKFE